ncbi:MAG TPA: DUF4136 domain-containing protein [Candidatus Acidoferrales bacterium]|nr:DUF4136 domain-containing protein [Candidatus Acidoferrales bacterium]
MVIGISIQEGTLMFRSRRYGAFTAALAIGFILLAAGSALAQDVSYNFVPGTDFSKYKTYHWVVIKSNAHPDQIIDQQIRQAIDAQLSAKGFTKTDTDQADLYVAYQVSVTQERQWDAYGMGGGWRFGGGMATATSTTIHVGTLGVDFYDPAAKQLIWRGQATKTLNPSKDPQKNLDRLNKAVAKLLKNFPPKSKK